MAVDREEAERQSRAVAESADEGSLIDLCELAALDVLKDAADEEGNQL
ncbi:hypothetical protein [Caballeronia sp. AZ7_KS35]|nr:hypothetical protein [Caballeronia sp. AZ7_KS35]